MSRELIPQEENIGYFPFLWHQAMVFVAKLAHLSYSEESNVSVKFFGPGKIFLGTKLFCRWFGRAIPKISPWWYFVCLFFVFAFIVFPQHKHIVHPISEVMSFPTEMHLWLKINTFVYLSMSFKIAFFCVRYKAILLSLLLKFCLDQDFFPSYSNGTIVLEKMENTFLNEYNSELYTLHYVFRELWKLLYSF